MASTMGFITFRLNSVRVCLCYSHRSGRTRCKYVALCYRRLLQANDVEDEPVGADTEK